MALIFEGATVEWQFFLDAINIVFTIIFALEAILKLIAYGLSYFKNTWNKFDFVVVISSLLDVMLSFLDANQIKFLRVGP